jgi:hypothetical protein
MATDFVDYRSRDRHRFNSPAWTGGNAARLPVNSTGAEHPGPLRASDQLAA